MRKTPVDPTNPRTWGRLHEMRDPSIRFSKHSEPADMQEWVSSVFIPTRHDRTLNRMVDTLVRRKLATDKHWGALDATGNSGKSEWLLDMAMRRTPWTSRGVLAEAEVDGLPQRPVVFVEASPQELGRGISAGILDALGVPSSGSERNLRRRLISLLPPFGVDIIVIDDSSFYRRSSESTLLPDALRATLRLPVTLIYAGTDLTQTALLRRFGDGRDGDDVVTAMIRRSHYYAMAPLSKKTDGPAIKDLVTNFGKHVHDAIPMMRFTFQKDDTIMRDFVRRTEGIEGSMYAALKDAAWDAIEDGSFNITAELLDANIPETPGTPLLVR